MTLLLQPLLLTMLGAAGTGLGGLLVVLQPQMSFVRLGALQVCQIAGSTAAKSSSSSLLPSLLLYQMPVYSPRCSHCHNAVPAAYASSVHPT